MSTFDYNRPFNDPTTSCCGRDAADCDCFPVAPYAVMCGLDGGYSPNTCDHYATLEDALTAVAGDLEHAYNGLLDTGDVLDAEELPIVDNLSREAAKIRRAIAGTDGTINDYALGDTWAIARYESITLTPISPEDYEAGDE